VNTARTRVPLSARATVTLYVVDRAEAMSAHVAPLSVLRCHCTVTPVPPAVAVPPGFDAEVGQGWEVFVYAVHTNWLRFENGLCQKIFSD